MSVLGHDDAHAQLERAFAGGRMHHAWLLTGPKGIGKATLAYRFAARVLGASGNEAQAARWIAARAHPSLFVLERAYDPKAKRIKTEIAVEDARAMIEFLAKTTGSGSWRVAIIDAADDLNHASANALLKAMEEPPQRTLLLLVCHNSGRIMRTIRSRCVRLELEKLSTTDVETIIHRVRSEEPPDPAALAAALAHASGSPGTALDLLTSAGAKAFFDFAALRSLNSVAIIDVSRRFASRATGVTDFDVFMALLKRWIAGRAREMALQGGGSDLAQAYGEIETRRRETEAYNLDRRQAALHVLSCLDKALRAARSARYQAPCPNT